MNKEKTFYPFFNTLFFHSLHCLSPESYSAGQQGDSECSRPVIVLHVQLLSQHSTVRLQTLHSQIISYRYSRDTEWSLIPSTHSLPQGALWRSAPYQGYFLPFAVQIAFVVIFSNKNQTGMIAFQTGMKSILYRCVFMTYW